MVASRIVVGFKNMMVRMAQDDQLRWIDAGDLEVRAGMPEHPHGGDIRAGQAAIGSIGADGHQDHVRMLVVVHAHATARGRLFQEGR